MNEKALQLYQNLSNKISSINHRTLLIVAFILFWILNSLFISMKYLSPSSNFKSGKPAPQTVISPVQVRIVDNVATEEARKKAIEAIGTVYSVDPAVEVAAINRLNKLFEIIENSRAEESKDTEKILAQLESAGFKNLKVDDVSYLLSISDQNFKDFSESVGNAAKTIFALRIKPGEKEIALSKATDMLIASGLNDRLAAIGTSILETVIIPNYVPDTEKTQQARTEAAKKVKEVIVSRQKGEVLIREGEIVRREHILLLKKLGLYRERADIPKIASTSVLVFLVQLGLVLYGLFFLRGRRKPYLDMVMLLIVVFLFNLLARTFIGTQYQYLIPLSIIVILTSMLIDETTSLSVLVTSIILMLLYPESSLQLTLVLIFPAVISIFMLRTVKQQSHLIRMGALLALATSVTSFLSSIIFTADFKEIGSIVLESSFGSFLSVVLSLGILPFFESVFHATSPLRLLELASANHPILKELMVKAPGTYNHSVMTANLAEAAAIAVGANPLLVRVGSYYHDIGKTKRPVFFVENQMGEKNPHDETNPSLSRLIISSHVRDGVEIARKHRFPDEIIEIIARHHGTTIIYPIYRKALEISGEDVREEAFRYNYGKPDTKEAAIVMLADSVEAASRTLARKSPEKLEKLIESIIRERLADGQLEEAPLTLRDLKKIEKAFVDVLLGLYHTRLEYPDFSEMKRNGLAKENNRSEEASG